MGGVYDVWWSGPNLILGSEILNYPRYLWLDSWIGNKEGTNKELGTNFRLVEETDGWEGVVDPIKYVWGERQPDS